MVWVSLAQIVCDALSLSDRSAALQDATLDSRVRCIAVVVGNVTPVKHTLTGLCARWHLQCPEQSASLWSKFLLTEWPYTGKGRRKSMRIGNRTRRSYGISVVKVEYM